MKAGKIDAKSNLVLICDKLGLPEDVTTEPNFAQILQSMGESEPEIKEEKREETTKVDSMATFESVILQTALSPREQPASQDVQSIPLVQQDETDSDKEVDGPGIFADSQRFLNRYPLGETKDWQVHFDIYQDLRKQFDAEVAKKAE